MKYVIASDIHGSALYCAQLLEAYKNEQAEKLILLGDILYHGPRNDLPEGYNPKSVISMLNEIAPQIACVQGNCDAEVDQMVLDFSVSTPWEKIGEGMYITHGHHLEDGGLPLKEGNVVFYGHTHIPAFEAKDGIVYINPGSVSIPKNGSQRGYILFDGKTVIFKNLQSEIIDTKNL